MALNTILAIIDPTSETQPTFERGLDTARDTGANLHLYCCANSDAGFAEARAMEDTLRPLLDDMLAKADKGGVNANYELEWDENWAIQAVAAAARCSASMILKGSSDHSPVDRELRQTSDWTLLRTAPCPVLMVKNFHDWGHRRVLAAINPASTESAHKRLDNQIVSFTRQLASSYNSDTHYVTAFADLNHRPDSEKIAAVCGTSPDKIHVRQGKAADVIRDLSAELDVDLIVVGTVARDGIKGRVIGNTCERLLDQTHSDVLVLN